MGSPSLGPVGIALLRDECLLGFRLQLREQVGGETSVGQAEERGEGDAASELGRGVR